MDKSVRKTINDEQSLTEICMGRQILAKVLKMKFHDNSLSSSRWTGR
jgi:carbamoylphosphate synthase small subunit